MAEPWQQWMPHDIDAWQGSANVQALSDLAYRAVHNLLQDMWKQPNCSLPTDDRELAKRSRVMQRWEQCRDEVLEYFSDRTETGRITHRVLLKKWNKAHEVYESRQKAAKETNAKRSANGDRNANRTADHDAKPTHEHEHRQEYIQEQKQKTTAVAVMFKIPPWISQESWDGYLEVRRKKRALNTDRALSAVIRRLDKYRARGHDPNEILETSLRSNWTDVYEPKANGGGNAGFKGSAERNWDALRAAIEDQDAVGGLGESQEGRTLEGGLSDFRLGPLGLPPVRH